MYRSDGQIPKKQANNGKKGTKVNEEGYDPGNLTFNLSHLHSMALVLFRRFIDAPQRSADKERKRQADQEIARILGRTV
jgi:hypothetical protein